MIKERSTNEEEEGKMGKGRDGTKGVVEESQDQNQNGESNKEVREIEAASVERSRKYTGIGKTGEGIPREKINPEILGQIEADSDAAYGYSPKKGSPYDQYDFTDIETVKSNKKVREDYLKQSEEIEKEITRLQTTDADKKDIAKIVVDMRNADKVKARLAMSPKDLKPIEQRNVDLYGNPVGPDAEWLFQDKKKKMTKKGLTPTDEEVWDSVIEGSMRKDEVINTLLGIEH